MPKARLIDTDPIAETLLIPLQARALEARRASPLVRDPRAAELLSQIDYDSTRFRLGAQDQASILLRLREFDRRTQAFLASHPEAVVVHIGCGLDTRFDRVDNGCVSWYDLDLPEVIALRRQLIDENPRCRMIAGSVFEGEWLQVVGPAAGRSFLCLAEGVLPYFETAQVRALVLTLQESFPESELVFDGMTPFMVWLHNLELRRSRIGARLRWGLRHGRELESWSPGLRLVEEWFYFDRPEPRLGASQLMRYCPPLAKGVGVFHYRLGATVSPG
jgi:O-methyltransferase involved in polyketide biosynthesis